MDPNQSEDPRRDEADRADATLAKLARRTAIVIVFERVWPALAWAATLAALFLAVSWFGVWQVAPRAGRIGGVLIFAVALGVALAPLARLRRPTRAEILARLDRDSGTPHRPAASLSDRLAGPGDDPTAAALWALHRLRLARMIERFRPAAPAPGMAQRDPNALRFAALLAAICAALVAGPERYGRLATAFDWRGGAGASAAARLDAWIDPPAYADKPPILIALPAPSEAAQTIVAPEDSALVVRAEGGAVETRVEGALAPVAAETPQAKPGASRRPPPSPARRSRSAGSFAATAPSRSGATASRSAVLKSGRFPPARPPSRSSDRRAPTSAAR